MFNFKKGRKGEYEEKLQENVGGSSEEGVDKFFESICEAIDLVAFETILTKKTQRKKQ